MSNSQTETASGGIGLGGAIFIVFLVLKLGGWGAVANWSWWWVTAPLWIPLAFVAVIFGILFVLAVVVTLVKK